VKLVVHNPTRSRSFPDVVQGLLNVSLGEEDKEHLKDARG
jgi:hypothetical protein